MTRPRLLVVDDKPTFLSLFQKIVGQRMDVHVATTGAKALGLLALESFDVIVTDIRMPGIGGMELLAEVKARTPDVEVIIITGFGTIAQAVQAMQSGAFSYLTKPFDPDDALASIEAALARRRANQKARTPSRITSSAETPLVGKSDAIMRLRELSRRAAETDGPLLLLGEVGTGKHVLARAIHDQSARSRTPFRTLSGRAWDGTDASEGTVFFTGVEELDAAKQAGLVSALRAGTSARWIFAAREPLDVAVTQGALSKELLEEIGGFPLSLPPLRDRQEDIPLLSAAILSSLGGRDGEPLQLTSEALAALVAYDWPGNVRELEVTLEAMARRSNSPRIGLDTVPEAVRSTPNLRADPARLIELSYKEVIDLARDRATRDYLVELLRAARGNVTRAAQRAAVERESFHRLLRRFHLRAEDFRERE